MDIHGVSKVTINDTVFDQAGDAGKNIFSNIIIYFATIFLLRYLVKSAVKGVCDLQYILLPWVEKNGKPAPGIVDCGNSMNADIEKIIDLILPSYIKK